MHTSPPPFSALRGKLPVLLALLLSACASTLAPHNAPLNQVPPETTYRSTAFERHDKPENLAFGMSFSGGGTRAAAFAFGVLEELSRSTVDMNGKKQRVLDLVDHISSVSGGSYTAAYYGLFGDRLFEDFVPRFLKRDVQDGIASTIFSASNVFRMTSPFFGRSDVIAEYLDRELFEGKTFADLASELHRSGRPFIVINATDMARTNRFEFTQDQFDLICSDIGSYKISRAVAASSAVPIIFTPITLANYAKRCNRTEPAWITHALKNRHESIRRYTLAADQHSYIDSDKRRFIHLLDGGLSDNLGLRPILDRLAIHNAAELADAYGRPGLRRLVHIVVNAQVHNDFDELDQHPEVPTLKSIAFAVSNTTDRFNVETLAYARSSLDEAARSIAAQATAHGMTEGENVRATLIEVSFDDLEDEEERAYFNALPTNFNLPPEAIDRLREVGARLLRESPAYRQLLRELPTLH